MAKIEGLLFDKDGTILDFYKTWVPINRDMAYEAAGGNSALAYELLRAGGHDPETDIVAPGAILGASSVEDIADCFASTLKNRTADQIVPIIAKHFRQGGAKYAVLIEGVVEHVKELGSRGFRLGLATNDTMDGMRASLGRYEGLIDIFEFHAGCDSGHGSKPAPGMGLAFAEAMGLDPSECAIIGDTSHDLEMGRRAGFGLRIGVLTGPNLRHDLEPHADYVIGSVCDLPDLLGQNLNSRPLS
jgi:phosphoglycolate phosphatase